MRDTKIKAIPTIYKGVQFRSRLEATWAAFFDLINIQWEYEPPHISFNKWIPDFVLLGNKKPNILVEVKPIIHYKEFDDFIVWNSKFYTILLGIQPFITEQMQVVGIGWSLQEYNDYDEIALKTQDFEFFGISEVLYNWQNKLNDLGGRDSHKWFIESDKFYKIQNLWTIAKNRTQYKGGLHE
jgi:hypothetical protein